MPSFVGKEDVVLTMVVPRANGMQEMAVDGSKRAGGARGRTQRRGGGDVAARWAGDG